MKKIIFITLLVIVAIAYPQTVTKEKPEALKFHGYANLTEEQQIYLSVQSIIQFYGKSFKYYDELVKGKYKVVSNGGNSFLEILTDKKEKNKQQENLVKLKKRLVEGHSIIQIDINEIKPLINNALNNAANFSSSSLSIVNRNNILIDKQILKNDKIPSQDWKILNRSFVLSNLDRIDGEDAVLFKDIQAGTILPYGNAFKLLTIDRGFCTSVYFDSEIWNFPEGTPINDVYGQFGVGTSEFWFPSDITIGRERVSSEIHTYPIFITDSYNNRIIKVDFVVNPFMPQMAHYENSTFAVFTEANNPYGVAYFKHLTDELQDKIWASGANAVRPFLGCYTPSGLKTQSITGYYDVHTNTPYLFNNNTMSRLAVINDYFAAIIFIDNTRNALVSCRLNDNGTAPTFNYNGSELIMADGVEFFPQAYPLTSVSFYSTPLTLSGFPFVLATSANYFHLFRMNNSAHLHYLASTDVPNNTDNNRPFTNLINTIHTDDYYDIFTIESWNASYGLRKYWFNADLHSGSLIQGCKDSLIKFQGTFTNDCWLYLQAYRKNRTGGWEPVKIKTLNGEPVNEYYKIRYQMAAWNRISSDLYINMDLELPIEDLALGGEVKLTMYMFPEYEFPSLDNRVRSYHEFTTSLQPVCLPKAGGCPFLYVLNEDGDYLDDNNLLHKYEIDPNGTDIVDKYKLQVKPKTENNVMNLFLVENEQDNSYFDQVKLYAIDRPKNKELVILENNEYALFSPFGVLASDQALHNQMVDITQNVNFYNPTSPVEGYKNDVIYAHFFNAANKPKTDAINKMKKSEIENCAFIAFLGNRNIPIPSTKNYAGLLSSYTLLGEMYQTDFSRREKSSIIAVPLQYDNIPNIDNVVVEWTSDFNLQKLGLTSLAYTGYSVYAIPLTYAGSINVSSESDVTYQVLEIDNEYGEVSSQNLIKLTFDISSLPSIPIKYSRDYVIEVSGHYIPNSPKNNSNHQSLIPAVFKLHQNYPNPFNPKATIKFDLPRGIQVAIRVYDILGREVKTLVNEFMDAGYHQIDFDGSSYASGVYFYRLEAGSFVQSKKMILAK